jgi:uncharacterized peroxidase-related enzyme
MKHYEIFTSVTAPEETSETLEALEEKIGFVPNVFSVMAGTPAVLDSFVSLNQNFGATSLDATEREIIQIAVSVENNGTYCVAGHTSFAKKQKVEDSIIKAVRTRGLINDPKLAALHKFARQVAINRGNLGDGELAQFMGAGYSPAQVLEVILGVCVKMFSNLSDNVLGFPLDKEFEDYAWDPKSAVGIPEFEPAAA